MQESGFVSWASVSFSWTNFLILFTQSGQMERRAWRPNCKLTPWLVLVRKVSPSSSSSSTTTYIHRQARYGWWSLAHYWGNLLFSMMIWNKSTARYILLPVSTESSKVSYRIASFVFPPQFKGRRTHQACWGTLLHDATVAVHFSCGRNVSVHVRNLDAH